MKYLDCYTRVSTAEQKTEGSSLTVQEDIGKRVAKKLGLKFRHRNEGARSSTIHYREVLEQLRSDITNGKVKHIWCLDRSRLFRDMTDGLMFRRDYLEKYGVSLYEGEFGREVRFDNENEMLTYDILTRLQEYENKVRSERSQRGKVEKLKRAGDKSVYLGGTALFGYENIKKQWTVNKDESKWVKYIFDSYEKGKTLLEVKKELDRNGVPPRRSKSGLWVIATLHKMLRNKSYTGIHTVYMKSLDKSFSFKVPKIITVSQFNRVQKLMDKNQKNKDNNKKHDNLLDGLLVCECGSQMGSIVREFTRGTGAKVSTKKYFCRSSEYSWREARDNQCTNGRTLYMDETDKLIMSLVKDTVRDSSILKEETKREVLERKNLVEKDIAAERNRLEDKCQRIQRQVDTLENQIVELEVDRTLEKRSESVINKILSRYEEELERQNSEYLSVENELTQLDENLIWVDWVKQFSDRINTNIKSTKNKKEFLRGLLESVVVKSVMGNDRDGKEVQVGHSLELNFKMKIVNDKLVWKDEKNKNKGYDLKNGKSKLSKANVKGITMTKGRKKKRDKA